MSGVGQSRRAAPGTAWSTENGSEPDASKQVGSRETAGHEIHLPWGEERPASKDWHRSGGSRTAHRGDRTSGATAGPVEGDRDRGTGVPCRDGTGGARYFPESTL